MRIGEVAREAGVNVQTLRYYERPGILKKVWVSSGLYGVAFIMASLAFPIEKALGWL